MDGIKSALGDEAAQQGVHGPDLVAQDDG